MTTKRTFIIATAALAGGAPVAVQAASIGINLGSGRDSASLAATDVAGVVPQSNWNNAAGATGSIINAVDNSGAATGVGVAWETDEQWSVGEMTSSPDGTLLNGFFSENFNNNDGSTVDITGIPYASYDLYIYLSHDRPNEDVYITELQNAFNPFIAVELDTDLNAPVIWTRHGIYGESGNQSGNYALFPGLSSPDLNLVFFAEDLEGSLDRNALSALQIVQVPEPSTAVFALLAAGIFTGRLRRR